MHKWQKVLLIDMIMVLVFTVGVLVGMTEYRRELPTFQNEGSVLIRANDGKTYGYFGDIVIYDDGTTGNQTWIEMDGYLVDYYPHESEGGDGK